MATVVTAQPATDPAARPQVRTFTRPRRVLLAAALAISLVILAVLHLSQGNASVGLPGVLRWLSGQAASADALVIESSRLPRTVAALAVGVCLGLAGTALQGLTRNPLASPDTLAVNSGAFLAVSLGTIFGLGVGTFSGGVLAFVGGIAGALLTLLLSGRQSGVTGLILVGTVISLALASVTSILMILYSQLAQGLYAWGSGSLAVVDLTPLFYLVPGAAVAALVLLVKAGKLDLLRLGDDEARALGERVWLEKLIIVVMAVGLASTSVAVAGPIAFVGLCAPALTRIALGPGTRHLVLMGYSAVTGVVIVLGADVALRAIIGTTESIMVPTGVITGLLGAVFLVVLSAGQRTGSRDAGPASVASPAWLRRHAALCTCVAVLAVSAMAIAGLLLGDGYLLLGDLTNWWQGVAQPSIAFVFDSRAPRVVAALLAGAALGLAGTLTQSATRNPLADPGLLGVSAGAGLGALVAIVFAPHTEFTGIAVGAFIGAGASALLVFVLSWRTRFEPTRLVLVGIGVAAGAASLTTLLVVRTNPYDQALAITWLGGSTYGASMPRLGLVAIVLMLGLLAALVLAPRLDLLQLDADTPVLLGHRVPRLQALVLGVAVVLTAASTTGVGVIGFVGLVAPHVARSIVGPLHGRLIPLAMLCGALLVTIADAFGRTVIAPAQLPVGLVCALVGAPIFLWLMRPRAV